MKRRKFVQNTAILSAGGMFVAPHFLKATSKNTISANEKLRFGVIGCNGMGWSDTRSLLKMDDVELIAIADVDQNVVKKRVAEYGEIRSNKLTIYGDYRKLLENKDIDFVVIGTPDHWHCKMMVDAVQAGKDVYVEKPIANSIEECNLMVDAAAQTGKVVQVGQWQRSGTHYQQALGLLSEQHQMEDVVLRQFEFALLEEMGLLPDWLNDAASDQPVQSDQWYIFVAEQGVMAAPAHIQRGRFPGQGLIDMTEGNWTQAARKTAKLE